MPKSREESREESHESRIEELKRRAAELAGGEMMAWESDELPPGIRERFWENIVACEEGEPTSAFDLLVEAGLELPPPAELDDARLPAKLEEVVRAMEAQRMYLLHTDHLDDRGLYTFLWEDVLREEGIFEPENERAHSMFDLVGSGSEEDIYLHLKHYADERDRQLWASDYPEDDIPEHEDPPHDRDRHLPRPTWWG